MKSNGGKVLAGYVAFMFVSVGVAPLFSTLGAEYYLSVVLFVLGGVAIVLQKRVHGERFVDMGFRLNRNAVLGVSVAAVFTVLALGFFFGVPLWLGMIRVTPNPATVAEMGDLPLPIAAAIIMIFGGLILVPPGLFGEELAFRGYLLPRMERHMGAVKAIIVNAVIFGLWHFPAYYSIYRGGAAEQGVGAVGLMLLGHGISVVPVCVLYLTTRELYGVSVYHALVDVFQYAVVGSSELGDAAKDALYTAQTLNEFWVNVIGWGGQVLSILVMLGLCRLIKPWVLPRPAVVQNAAG